VNQEKSPIRPKKEAVPADGCLLYDVGRQAYLETLELQMTLHRECWEGTIGGALIAVEHEPVITLGVRTLPADPDELIRM